MCRECMQASNLLHVASFVFVWLPCVSMSAEYEAIWKQLTEQDVNPESMPQIAHLYVPTKKLPEGAQDGMYAGVIHPDPNRYRH